MYKGIFERVNLSALAESLIYGTCVENSSNDDYEQRMKTVESELAEQLDQLLSNDTAEEVQEIVFQFFSMANGIYFELGMKAGAMLQRQLLEGLPDDLKLAVEAV